MRWPPQRREASSSTSFGLIEAADIGRVVVSQAGSPFGGGQLKFHNAQRKEHQGSKTLAGILRTYLGCLACRGGVVPVRGRCRSSAVLRRPDEGCATNTEEAPVGHMATEILLGRAQWKPRMDAILWIL